MWILHQEGIKLMDQATLKQSQITSTELMQNAALAFSNWFINEYQQTKKVYILVGPGNNGGDGWAVASILSERGYRVQVICPEYPKISTDAEHYRSRFVEGYKGRLVTPDDWMTNFTIQEDDIIIDALFGISLNRPIDGIFSSYISFVNKQSCTVVSIDLPSGIHPERGVIGPAIRADKTGSMGCAKESFFYRETAHFIGEWEVLDIGWPKELVDHNHLLGQVIEEQDIIKNWSFREKFSHKSQYGRGLLIGGSTGMMGAIMMASQAALRSGLGLLTVHVPHKWIGLIQSIVPEAMVSPDDHPEIWSVLPSHFTNFDVIGVGPGLGRKEQSKAALSQLLKQVSCPLVLDADALHDLKEHLSEVPPNTILTPHVGEFDHLFGAHSNDRERFETQDQMSKKWNVTIVLKGPYTRITFPDGTVFYNQTGNPGLAKGGSGDILTGMMVGLIGRLHNVHHSVLSAVFLHGLAGDLAKESKGIESMMGRDVIGHISSAFLKLKL